MNLFTYGSLILPEVWEAVTGEQRASEAGSIRGYIRRTVAGATFPGILYTGNKNDRVDGAIYRDIDSHSLESLDQFESDFYIRKNVDAHGNNGTTLACGAYVVPSENSGLLSEEEWSLEKFTHEHLDTFLARNF